MATDDQSAGVEAQADERPCPPCRGTGRIISTLGGSPSEVTCPWCEGTGRWLRDHDAQARWRGEGGAPVA